MTTHIRNLGLLGAVVLVAAIVIEALTQGYGTSFSDLINTGWGRTITLDLYVGLAFVAAWIWHRESSSRTRMVWILSLLIFGNIATGIYVGVSAARSSDVTEFLTGNPTA